MAVFVSATDENTDGHDFFLGGLIAPEKEWSEFFAPVWQQRVLDGPPSIPFLHMTEIRSRKFREKYKLSRYQAEERIDEAVAIITQLGTLRAGGIDLNSLHFRQEMKEIRFRSKSGGIKKYHPDYSCFNAYAYALLLYLEKWHPEVEKVDFLVERNGEITKHIQTFHSHLYEYLRMRNKPHLARLVGELLPVGKERIPTQAADVLCWHIGRARHPETMDNSDIRRYNLLIRIEGFRVPLDKKLIADLRKAFEAASI